MMRRYSPMVRRRELAAIMRGLREDRGRTVTQVASDLMINLSQLSRLETGQRAPVLRDVKDLCRYYDLDEATSRRLMGLARASREQGWWQQYAIEPGIADYIGLETAAESVDDFEPMVAPGLLQTPDYASVVIRSMNPDYTDEQVLQTVEARLQRQQILTAENPIRFHAVIDESVLYREIGGPAVLQDQLRRLLKMGDMSTVTVQVLPFSAGAHPGLDSTFSILTFTEDVVSSTVYVEGQIGQIFLEKEADVARYRRTFEALTALAFQVDRSRDLVADRIDELSMKQET